MSPLTFQKNERLKNEKVIKDLFTKGSSFYLYPYKIFFIKNPFPGLGPDNPQILVSVSKRNFKRAVDRNRLKRQLREAYRINKPELLKKIPLRIFPAVIGIMYVSKEKLPFDIIQNKLNLAFDCFESKPV